MNKRGFTLVELLAVIAILAILVIIALPNVLELFNSAKKESFYNEVQSVYNSAKNSYLLDQLSSNGSMKTYTNLEGNNALNLQNGSDDFKYCISVDSNGNVIAISVTNGKYKYDDAIIDKIDANKITEVGEDYTFNCEPAQSTFVFVNKQNQNQITAGDEVALGSEHFYVVSSNESKTVLLSKYNLYVGNNFSRSGTDLTFASSITSSDAGYCLQNSSAIGSNNPTDLIGVVPFSGINYWHSSKCTQTDRTWTCYIYYYNEPYPLVYDSTQSTISPIIDVTGRGVTMKNDYTIAYYIEEYVRKLKLKGAPSTIEGRLLTMDDAAALNCSYLNCSSAPSWLISTSYWMGNAKSNVDVLRINKENLSSYSFYNPHYHGVRPVIEVYTSDLN